MSTRHLTASRRRLRKEQLARRHGARCTYCLRPFASLREATLDHVVPVSLFRTWAVVHLMLACRACNHAKADRLPLSMALLLAWSTSSDGPTVHPVEEVEERAARPVFTAPGDVFTPITHRAPGLDSGSGKPPVGSGGSRVDVGGIHPASTPGHLAFWLLLTRLAHTRQSTAAPHERCGERREQSTPGQGIHRRSGRRAVRVGRLEHQRRTPRLNTCEQPTDRGVSA
ncbi:HNH endonuclease [Streptomyces atroolivaceus]|uniref:HNH endonuclease n=1 Tax=Streptomyces atroolivaceus TaxID=66869 RepID=A0ABV9UZH7_STRAZ|nr:HNH endonuclease [Streptomyces atroolivaceus]